MNNRRPRQILLVMLSGISLLQVSCPEDSASRDFYNPGLPFLYHFLYGVGVVPPKGELDLSGKTIYVWRIKVSPPPNEERWVRRGTVWYKNGVRQSRVATPDSYVAEAGPELPGKPLGQWCAGVALDSSQALFSGGYEPGKNFAIGRAYLVDAPTNAVHALPDMLQPRRDHRMVCLNDNSVLITGGYTGENPNAFPLDTAERFDPATRTFKAVGNMSRKRSAHNMTMLSDGRVLVVGGDAYDPNATDLYTAEIFDPVSETFSPAAPPTDDWKFAVTLNDGRVLAGGAFDQTKAAIYDPTTNAWSPTGAMNSPHSIRPTATVLPDGRVLVVGGWDLSRTATRNTDLYDPAAGLFTAGPAMNHARHAHVAFFMPDGNVLIAAGQNEEGDYLDSFEVFDPDSNTITLQDSRMSSPSAFGAGVGMMP